jgi:hypothetical protein
VTLWSIRSTVVAVGVTATCAGSVRKRSASSGSPSAWSPRRTGSGASLGEQLHDRLQRMDEAEVEHLVGLVEDEDLDSAKHQIALLDEVEQAARRRDEDVDSAGDVLAVLADRGAAEHGGDAHQLAEPGIAFALSAICEASSRVGARTSIRQVRGCGLLFEPASRSIEGSMKAAVLPVPVWAMPSRSRPWSRIGIAWPGSGSLPCNPSARAPGGRAATARDFQMTYRAAGKARGNAAG